MKNKWMITMVAATLLAACGNCKTQEDTQKADSVNIVTETIMARRSIRHYTDSPVGKDTLLKLAEYGVNAPNARNLQEWAVRIVDNQEYLDEITQLMKAAMPMMTDTSDPKFRNGFRNASAVIFVATPDDEHGMNLINVGALCENICLAAQSMGLGSVVMGGPIAFMNNTPDVKPYMDRLNLPQGYKLRICVGIGHPDEAPEAKPRDLGKIEIIK